MLHLLLMMAGLTLPAESTQSPEEAPPLRVATFECDITPPMGYMIHWHKPLVTVENRLLAKGIVLEDKQRRYVVCALDWCLVSNSMHRLLRQRMAQAVGTDASCVAVQCVHQHTAPRIEADVQKLLDEANVPYRHFDVKFFDEVTARLAAAEKEAIGALEPFDSIGTGRAKVDRVASSRRIIVEGGKLRSRMSGTKDPELRALPEGTIDPILKTITLARGDKPLVRMHYYATHPQSFYGDGRACIDVPGFARQRMEEKESVFQIYFTGCAGDVAMGKYNDRSRGARDELTDRVYAGMEASIASTRFAPADRITWRRVALSLPPRTDPGHTVADYRATLADPEKKILTRILAARHVAYAQRSDQPIELSSLQIGTVHVLHLPGEPMVEFQLHAQRMMPNDFVAVAELGDWSPGYICTKRAFAEGGYEPSASNVAPQAETLLKAAIGRLLGLEDESPAR